MGTTILGESLASRCVGVMTDDDDGVASASGLSGSLSLCLAPHYLSVSFFFFFFFPSSVPGKNCQIDYLWEKIRRVACVQSYLVS